MSENPYCDMGFYGSVTVGERGQIVIPAEARTELGYGPGDKLLIVRHPNHKGLMVFKLDHAKKFLEELSNAIDHASQPINKEDGK